MMVRQVLARKVYVTLGPARRFETGFKLAWEEEGIARRCRGGPYGVSTADEEIIDFD